MKNPESGAERTENKASIEREKKFAGEIYDILVRFVGADDDEDQRSNFIYNWDGMREWRFMGKLAFGGKFYKENDRWTVSCYPEDRSPERDKAIEQADAALAQLKERYDRGE